MITSLLKIIEINSRTFNIIAENETRRIVLEAKLEGKREKQIADGEDRRRKYEDELEEQRQALEKSHGLRVKSMMASIWQQVMGSALAAPTRHLPFYYSQFVSPPAMDSTTPARHPLSYYTKFTQNTAF